MFSGLGDFGYALLALESALGEFDDIESFYTSSSTSILYLKWFVWLLSVFLCLIVFMNFIIAVISESYEKSMQNAIAREF